MTFETRFWSKVAVAGIDECWVWTAGRHTDGYGQFAIGSRKDGSARVGRAHRIAWELTWGKIPAGLKVLHNCPNGDNPACCNPRHLWLGTDADNAADKAAKGRCRPATGDRHGSRTKPDRVPHGERLPHSKLRAVQIPYIRCLLKNRISQTDIARAYCVRQTSINMIAHGKSWMRTEAAQTMDNALRKAQGE